MKRMAYVMSFALALGVAAAAFVWGMRNESRPGSDGSSDLASLSFQPHPGVRLPLDEKLVDAQGRSVSLGTYFDKTPVILVLEYLRCTSLCGVTLRNLIGATLKGLPFEPGRDYQLVAISIDPRDRPVDAAAAEEKYAVLFGRRAAKAGFHLLTGAPAAIRAIADAVGFPYRYDSLLDAYIHPAGFIVAAPDGQISRYLEGFAVSSSDMISAFADARQDKSQDPVTRLLLLCRVRSGALGRFTVPVIAALTIANIGAGLAALATFVAIRRRRYG
jgi:protein SCO1/2